MKIRKITYLVQQFRPRWEGTSKEVALLYKHFNSTLNNIHLKKITSFSFKKNFVSYHAIFYPLAFPFLFLSKLSSIIHVYTSLCDRPYLIPFPKKKMVLTSTNYFSRDRIKERIKHLRKVHKIVVESEIQLRELEGLGIKRKKIALVYPPVDLSKFSYKAAKGKFKILAASCPKKPGDIKKRGLLLLTEIGQFEDFKIDILVREGTYHWFKKLLRRKKCDKISLRHAIVSDMNKIYANIHCTIIPYLRLDENLKLMPNSAIESLAAGKPVLASKNTGIALIVRKEKCGVVFEPTKKGLLKAIKEIRKNYWQYQKNCRPTAEKYFSQEKFIKSYEKTYSEI